MVVGVLELGAGALVVTELEQHDSQLVLGGAHSVELLGRLEERRRVVVGRQARRDDDDVQRGALRVRLQLLDVPREDLLQARPELALAAGLHVAEDPLRALALRALLAVVHLPDVVVPGLAHRHAREVEQRPVVDEVDVDAVLVVLQAHGRHRLDQRRHVAPLPLHVLRVVDDEQRLEVLQER